MRKNTIFMILYEGLIYVFPLITTAYVARALGTTGIGIYSYSNTIATYFVIFIQLGVSLYGRREIAKVSHNKILYSQTFWGIFLDELFMFVISTAVYIIVSMVIFSDLKLALFLQYFILVAALLDVSWFFFGMEEFGLAVARNTAVKVVSLILIFMFVKEESDTYKYIAIMSLVTLFSSLSLWIPLLKRVQICDNVIRSAKKHIKPMFVMFIPVLSTHLYSLTDKLVLGLLVDVDTVGIYENVYKISRVPITFINCLGTVMLPRMTNLISKGETKKSREYIGRSLSFTFGMSCAFAFGIIAVSSELVTLYLGDDFSSGIGILNILALVLLPIGWGNVFRTQYILPNGQDSLYARMVSLAAVINLCLNFIVIPRFYGVGAAAASLAAELFICFYQTYYIRKEFPMLKYFKCNLKYLLSGIVMCMMVRMFSSILNLNGVFGLMIEVLIGALIFVLMSLGLEIMTKQYCFYNELMRYMHKFSERRIKK